ncbi:MAG: hypothetical protein QNJ16_16635 [Rhodobacter sp.]|nr:hypothetical protein [Rhodobacter sp.]
MSALAHPFAVLGNLVTSFGHTGRFEHLFSLSDAELSRRGLDRDALVKSYITGLTHN